MAFTNPNASAGSIRSPLRTRPLLLPGSLSPHAESDSPDASDAAPSAPRSLTPRGDRHQHRLGSPNYESSAPTVRTPGLNSRALRPALTRPNHLRPELHRIRRSRSRHSLNTPLWEQSQVIQCPPNRVNLRARSLSCLENRRERGIPATFRSSMAMQSNVVTRPCARWKSAWVARSLHLRRILAWARPRSRRFAVGRGW